MERKSDAVYLKHSINVSLKKRETTLAMVGKSNARDRHSLCVIAAHGNVLSQICFLYFPECQVEINNCISKRKLNGLDSNISKHRN